ncbi:unnamed protein product [Camellia sinensis]
MEYYLMYMEKIPCQTSTLIGLAWTQELFDRYLGRCEQNLHMPLYVFQALCDTLRCDFGLRVPKRLHGLHIEESVGIFIHMLDGCTNHKIQERFQHSRETVSRHFHVVLEVMKLFIEEHCKPTRDQNNRHPYLRSRGKYIHFKVSILVAVISYYSFMCCMLTSCVVRYWCKIVLERWMVLMYKPCCLPVMAAHITVVKGIQPKTY